MLSRLIDVFSYLINFDYEKLLDDYGLPALIIFISFLLARYVFNLLQRTICRSLLQAQTFLNSNDLAKITAIFILIIPAAAIDFSVRSLIFPSSQNIWLYTSFLVVYQLLLSLLLLYIIQPMLRSWVRSYINLYKKVDFTYAEELGKKLESRRLKVCYLLRFLMLITPATTVVAVFIGRDYAVWLLPTLVLLVSMLAYFRLKAMAKKQLQKIEAASRKKRDLFSAPEHVPMPGDPDFKERIGVINLFLEIFKNQLEATEFTPAYFVQIKYDAAREYFSYELRVKIKNDWQARRMSLGRLGDTNTSRCRCFYVIYDEYIVVKIPVIKIVKLKDYIKIIKKEQNIAEKTGIKTCITPNVSIILKHVSKKEKGRTKTNYNEDLYQRLLFSSSSLHKYLQINDHYVFFMELSQYYFVEYALKSIHSLDEKVTKDIFRQAEIAWNFLELEHRYGREIVKYAVGLRKIFKVIEAEHQKSIDPDDPDSNQAIYPFQLKQWFFGQLSGYHTEAYEWMSEELVVHLSSILKNILKKNSKFIAGYRQVVRKTLYEAEFLKNKTAMEGITVNLLRLLAQLRKSRVAIRDIKPDNLLLAGNKNDYPVFMEYPDSFQIGLIDVETAAYPVTETSHVINQPLLGGTPHYATPAHFFHNDVLEFHFHDVQTTLHLQDWHAVLVIIYNLVTGEVLFEKTTKKISHIIQAINKSHKTGTDITDVLVAVSKEFWNSALQEFDQKLRGNKKILREARIIVPVECIDFFTEQLSREPLNYRLTPSQQKQVLNHLKQPEPVLPIYNLIEIIFSIILQHMYKPDWSK